MERKLPASGEFYRHFKGKIYQIKMIAKDSETEEMQVIYQGMYPPFQYWVRPLESFMSEVDRQKYPDAHQKMRFARIYADALEMMGDMAGAEDAAAVDRMIEHAAVQQGKQIDDETLVKALQSGQPGKYLSEHITDREIAERGCMQILDAETYREKRQLMIGMKPYLDKRLLHNIAAALDIVLEEGDLDSQYDSLLHCLDTMEHFEGGRLR